MNDLPELLASRLNFDVVLFRGHTRREMMLIGLISLVLMIIVLGVCCKLLLGMFLVGLGLSFPMAIPVGWVLSVMMQTFKEDKPKGYVRQQFLLWLEDHRFKRSPFIRYSGLWSIRRFF